MNSIQYLTNHEPILYIVKRRYLFFYGIANIYDGKARGYMLKFEANAKCSMYNLIHLCGYKKGCAHMYNVTRILN
jgi:hypothetical protein